MKNLQEVRNVADWKWNSGDIEMQQHKSNCVFS